MKENIQPSFDHPPRLSPWLAFCREDERAALGSNGRLTRALDDSLDYTYPVKRYNGIATRGS